VAPPPIFRALELSLGWISKVLVHNQSCTAPGMGDLILAIVCSTSHGPGHGSRMSGRRFGDRILSGRLLCVYDNARRASKDYYLTSLGASEQSWIPWSGIC
jgi:hypothetical protein